MIRHLALIVAAASVAVSCSSPTAERSPAPKADPMPTTFASEQAELDYLRAENAKLRGQNTQVVVENAKMRDRASAIEANQKAVESGKLEAGMTVHEANKVINGSANLYRDTCQLIKQTDDEWTYRILSGSQTGGPGSGGATSLGTNMRAGMVTPIQTWICTFDSQTGKLVRFTRETRSTAK